MNQAEQVPKLPDGYPEICADLMLQIELQLKRDGIDPDKASVIAFNTAEHVRKHWGGSMIYIARGMHFNALQWQKDMYAKFNGKNHEELAHEYKVSVQYVYQVVKLMRAAELAERQKTLF
jgi:Mor family transcriptional regulator